MKFDKKVILAYSDPAGFNIIGALIDEFIANRKKHNIDFKVFTNHEGIINKEYSSFIEIISNSLSEVLAYSVIHLFLRWFHHRLNLHL